MISLKKDTNRDFRVLNLTDPHLSELMPEGENLTHLKQTVETLVCRTAPQLITVSGDLGYSDWANYPDVRRYFGDLMESFGLPWALVWGNHDNQGGPERIQESVAFFRQYPHFCYESGDPALGNGNYVISIEQDGKPVAGLVMMDAHDRMPYTDAAGKTEEAWAKLSAGQIAWYEEEIQKLKQRGCDSTVVILHMPIYAYREAFRAAFRQDLDLQQFPPDTGRGAACWNPGYEDSFGVRYEEECSYPEDDHVFDKIEALGSTKIVLCGHDHANNWSVRYHGVRLTYGLKTGRGSYSTEALNGGTVLDIRADGTIELHHEFVTA